MTGVTLALKNKSSTSTPQYKKCRSSSKTASSSGWSNVCRGWLLLVVCGLCGNVLPMSLLGGLRGAAATSRLPQGLPDHSSRTLLVEQSQQQQPLREICQNTCNKAKNGVCEEGRMGKVTVTTSFFMAYCDLGTDCDDCGPWRTSAANVTWEDPKGIGPVRLLKSRDVQIRVRNAAVPPTINFVFAYTDPQKDYDVSYHMEGTSIVEAGISGIVYKLLKDRCVKPDGSRHLVVDVGANFGWFAILAARMGCRVIAYEPVPLFRAFFEYNVHLNNLANLIEVRSSVVSQHAGKSLKMVVPSRGIWGTAGIEGLNIDRSIQSDQHTIEVPSVKLEDEIKSDVLLLKVDVEGWEWAVIKGADGLLSKHEVENIIMEYSPGVPERHFRWDEMLAHPAMLASLINSHGYRVGHIGDGAKHQNGGWDAQLPIMPEVTTANLKYDIEDIKRWKAGTLACPSPEELQQFPNWKQCGGVPEGLNGRSFRSELSHNTNVWAVKAKRLAAGAAAGPASPLRLDGMVGVLDPSDPPDKYFQTKGFGMGSRICESLEAKWQVKHRCRCTFTECAAEEVAVDKAASLGKLPQNYVLS